MEGDYSSELRDVTDTHGKRRGLIPTEQQKLYALRNSFRKALTKLSSNETKDIAIRELQKLIGENATSEALRIFLAALTEQNKPINTLAKEAHIALLGYVASVFKEEMVDALDKPPSLLKTVIRVVEAVHKALAEGNEIIHSACAASLIKVFEHCLHEADNDTVSIIFYAPLEGAISSGNNRVAQSGASICLHELFMHLKERKCIELLKFFAPKFFNLFTVS
eukprot:TRINITY_DN1976_c0_g5_i1.p1 TRINITY_DN1976_c0_g5~~TRINITY_DN1976_c0_g5_i1.p1  ORF type:complete len:222 (+),score=39.36 TRINITY_DN1976_c0_g5_i1:72-737(+)